VCQARSRPGFILLLGAAGTHARTDIGADRPSARGGLSESGDGVKAGSRAASSVFEAFADGLGLPPTARGGAWGLASGRPTAEPGLSPAAPRPDRVCPARHRRSPLAAGPVPSHRREFPAEGVAGLAWAGRRLQGPLNDVPRKPTTVNSQRTTPRFDPETANSGHGFMVSQTDPKAGDQNGGYFAPSGLQGPAAERDRRGPAGAGRGRREIPERLPRGAPGPGLLVPSAQLWKRGRDAKIAWAPAGHRALLLGPHGNFPGIGENFPRSRVQVPPSNTLPCTWIDEVVHPMTQSGAAIRHHRPRPASLAFGTRRRSVDRGGTRGDTDDPLGLTRFPPGPAG